jgi:transcription elongation factor GreA
VESTPRGVVLTREGYEELQRELEELLTAKRPALVERIKEAIRQGDLSENFDYQDSKRQQGMMEARIRELKMIIGSAQIIDASERDGHIGLGSKVTVRDVADGFEEEFLIVGPAEANPSDGKISHESSVGEALMGRKAGEKVTVESPGGEFEYEIVSVR